GMYHFWVGYRLDSGEIIYNPMPIRLEVRAGEQPYFPGIVQIVSTDVDGASLAWLPASDNKTLADAIRYEVHLSDQPGFEPMVNTLHTSVTGVNQVELEELTTATSYSVLVVAVDADGNRSKERDYRTVTTFEQPVVVSSTTKFAVDKQLGLGEATTEDGTVFTYPSPTPNVQPEVASVLFVNVGRDVYLRKVDSVENTAAGLVVHTSEGALTEVLETGTIDTQLKLFDINDVASRSGTQAGLRTSRSLRDGIGRHIISWQNDLLVAEQTDHVEDDNSNRVRNTRQKLEYEKEVSKSGQSDETDQFLNESGEKETVKFGSKSEPGLISDIKFEPQLKTKVAWEKFGGVPVGLKEARIVASGHLTAKLGVTYNFGAEVDVEKKFELFKRTFYSTYTVGVPVYQVTTLSLNAVFTAKAEAKIDAEAIATAVTFLKIGITWNPVEEKWENIFEKGFTNSITADVKVHGEVVGEVRLIPNIEVEFYKSLAANLSIEPFIKATIAAETSAHENILEGWGYLKTQLTKFEVDLQVEVFISASLEIFSKEWFKLEKTNIWASSWDPLFSLPKLGLEGASGKVGEAITLTATVEDGVRNPFNDSSIDWDVDPDKATVSGGRTGTFESDEEGTYTVFFSGCGNILPCDFAKQFAFAEVTVEPEDDNFTLISSP
ncbi:MAG: hypothetical protein DRR19_27235, partial [Candidatus Parabeggiatoa sp. nov. 1]